MQKTGFLTTRLKYYDSVLNVFFREVGIIAGSVVGVVVFFGIAVSLISCCCCHSNERRGYVKVNEGNILREINLAISDKAGCLSDLLIEWEII